MGRGTSLDITAASLALLLMGLPPALAMQGHLQLSSIMLWLAGASC